jgi:hypothetical protein
VNIPRGLFHRKIPARVDPSFGPLGTPRVLTLRVECRMRTAVLELKRDDTRGVGVHASQKMQSKNLSYFPLGRQAVAEYSFSFERTAHLDVIPY